MKKVTAILLTFILLASFASCGKKDDSEATEESVSTTDLGLTNNCVIGENKHDIQSGNIIYFGEYPKERVMDEDIIKALEDIADDEESEWYTYSTNSGYAEVVQYKDVTLSDTRYRAVKNKKDTDWFQYEPLEWYVLDEEEGLVICEDVIDYQPYAYESDLTLTNWSYEDGSKASDYYKSYINNWLINDFYQTAFENSHSVDGDFCSNLVDRDSVEIPSSSIFEISAYGLKDNGAASPTYYAQAVGAPCSENDDMNTEWLLKDTADDSTVSYCSSYGSVVSDHANNIIVPYGIRPIINIDSDYVSENATVTKDQITDLYKMFEVCFGAKSYDSTSEKAINNAWNIIINCYTYFEDGGLFGCIESESIKDPGNTDGTDPLEKFKDAEEIVRFNADDADTLLETGFCVTPDHEIESDKVYYDNGYYYIACDSEGGGPYGGFITGYTANSDGTYTFRLYDESYDTEYEFTVIAADDSAFCSWGLKSMKVSKDYEKKLYEL